MKMKLLIITTIFPNPGNMTIGAYNREFVSELSELFDVDVIAPIPWINRIKFGPTKSWILNNAHVYHPIYYYLPGMLQKFHALFYYLSIRSIANELSANKKYSAVIAMWISPDGAVAQKVARNLSVPYYVKVLGTDVNRLHSRHPLYSQSIDVLKNAAMIFCVSEGLKNRLSAIGVSSENLLVIRNGINKNIFIPCNKESARNKLQIPENLRLILFVGNLKREKGLYELVQAFKLIINKNIDNQTALYLIGEGPFKRDIYQYVKAEGISDAVHLIGRKDPIDVALWMNAASVLCLPSYSEGMPNVVLEALCCNTPVVATAIDGILELAEQDHRITVVPPKEVESLGRALMQVLNNNTKASGELVIKNWSEFAEAVSDVIMENNNEHSGRSQS